MNDLSVMLLGAVQVDRDFNVNVVMGGNGTILGGPGGHPDTAGGADLSIVTTTLVGGGYAKCVDRVDCVTTIGSDIDVVVTDAGIAVNTTREDIIADLDAQGITHHSMDALIACAAETATEAPVVPQTGDNILVEHRAGTVLEAI